MNLVFQMFDWTFALMRTIPPTVWAALFGSLLTLGGVLLTNRGQNSRFLRQLEHDHQQRNRERQLHLKQEVLLNAAEGLTKMQAAISSMSNLELEYSEIGNIFSSGAAAIQKVYVVASNKTVSALSAYTSEASVTLLGLLSKRGPLTERQSHLAWLCDAIQKAIDEKDRLLALMREANIKGISDPGLWERLQGMFDLETKQSDDWSRERDETFKVQTIAHMDMLKLCYSEQMRLSYLLTPLLAAVREELELEFDIGAYEELMRSLAPRAEKAINALVGEISRDVES